MKCPNCQYEFDADELEEEKSKFVICCYFCHKPEDECKCILNMNCIVPITPSK